MGQFLFAPLTVALISTIGWGGGMLAVAAIMLSSLPLSWSLRSAPQASSTEAAAAPRQSFSTVVREALRDKSYLLLHAGFFTCGFHVAFLVTHLPTEVSLCGLQGSVAASALAIIGLSNMAGSLGVGWLARWVRQKYLLAGVYFVRVIAIAGYLMAPHTALTFYVFAGVLGLSWLSTVPPTAGLVGKLFGTRYLATLFGLTLLSHQTGAFFGAWVGGWVLQHQGGFAWMWYADMLLALAAALINLPIREGPVGAKAALG
jgi:predicted MFS family arabinose efflux permease